MDKDKKTPKPGERHEEAEESSKGQYGGLTGLGPGGGRDIEDAADTEDVNREDVERTRK